MTVRGVFLAAAVVAAASMAWSNAARAQNTPGNSLTADPYGQTYLPPGTNQKGQQQNFDPALAAKPDAKALTPTDPGYNSQQKQKLPTEAPWLAMERKLAEKHKSNPMDDWYVGPVAQGDEVADMSQPHRSQKEVADWLVLALSEIMSMDYANYEPHLHQMQTGMNDHAVAQLEGWMLSSNMLEYMKTQNVVMRCYVEEQPTLLNKGPVDGRFRWLYDVPVNISLLPPDVKTYENTQAGAVSNQHVILRMQIGRMPKGVGIDQLMLETFEVRQNPQQQIPVNH
ncbi:MAG TPA: DotI/IcmL family type IV secretion protein [Patescibacteria group bacterium]|nr:DotI/IcmL family type IV secretion protein [Patescibacteria group bacterium]